MSFSDLTRSYTTFPSLAPTGASSTRPSPVQPSSTAKTGASNIPGYSIAAGETTRAPSASAAVTSLASSSPTGAAEGGGGGKVNEGLALGLGLGLGLAALITVLAAVFVVRQRKTQREEFDRRAEGIRATMSQVQQREQE